MTKSQKILVIGSFEDPSGAPMATLRLARGLSDRGHCVKAFFLYRSKDMPDPVFPFEVLFRGRPKLSGKASLIFHMLRIVNREKPDSVVTFMPFAHALGQVSAFLSRVPVRLISHRGPVNTYWPTMQIIDAVLAWTKVYTHVTAPSASVLSSCTHYPWWLKRSATVINNGLLGFNPSPLTRTTARLKFGVQNDEFLLVAVGRLSAQKNFEFLLPVMQTLARGKLLIAGEGELRGELEAGIFSLGIGERVRLLGNLLAADTRDLLAAADLFVQPSLFEGQSNALLEALSSGLPALVSNQPEQIETVVDDDGNIAGSVLPLETEKWVSEIEKFQSDRALLASASAQAAQRGKYFSFERMIDGFERALNRS